MQLPAGPLISRCIIVPLLACALPKAVEWSSKSTVNIMLRCRCSNEFELQ